MRGLTYAEGFVPFPVMTRNKFGDPYEEWDGETYLQYEGKDTTAASSVTDDIVPVTGPGTPYPIGLPLSTFAALYWRPREWKLSVPNEEDLKLSVDSITLYGATAEGGEPSITRETSEVRCGMYHKQVDSDDSGEPIYGPWHEMDQRSLLGGGLQRHRRRNYSNEVIYEEDYDMPLLYFYYNFGCGISNSSGEVTTEDEHGHVNSMHMAKVEATVDFTFTLSIFHGFGKWFKWQANPPAICRGNLYYPRIEFSAALVASKFRYAKGWRSSDGGPLIEDTLGEGFSMLRRGAVGPYPPSKISSYASPVKISFCGLELDFPARWELPEFEDPYFVFPGDIQFPWLGTPQTNFFSSFPIPKIQLTATKYFTYGGIYDEDTGERV